jgi:hypothetical protein
MNSNTTTLLELSDLVLELDDGLLDLVDERQLFDEVVLVKRGRELRAFGEKEVVAWRGKKDLLGMVGDWMKLNMNRFEVQHWSEKELKLWRFTIQPTIEAPNPNKHCLHRFAQIGWRLH